MVQRLETGLFVPTKETAMISDENTVQQYATQHAQMVLMLENLQEYVGTMPAPDEDGNIPGVDYGYIGDVGRVHALLKEASDLVYEMGA